MLKFIFYILSYTSYFEKLQNLSFSLYYTHYVVQILRIIFPQIYNNTDRTLDVVFSRFRGFSFTITMRQTHTSMLSYCLVIQHVTLLGFCLRVTVKETSLNLEKTTSGVLFAQTLKYNQNSSYKIFITLLFVGWGTGS